jgi:predicted ATPase
VFTDIEGSTGLWESSPEAMRVALPRHDVIVREAIEARGGYVFATGGDGFAAAFARAGDALEAAAAAQTALESEAWPEGARLRVRIGVHTGEVTERGGDYFGPAVNRAARLMESGHGGQVLVSSATASVVGAGGLVDLGEQRLRDLAGPERVFQLSSPGLPTQFPPLRTRGTRPGNLPRQMTSFVGRAREVESVIGSLRGRQLVTLTGVGGVGKTRLALQAAAETAADFPDGAWLCELAPVTNPDAVWDALAASLGVKPALGRGLSDTLLEYLALKTLLLVLDNCEHLLDAVARLVDAITRSCPQVVVLATSREGLGLAGERMIAVPSLGLPEPGAAIEVLAAADAVQLFVARAGDARADFALAPNNATAIAQLCRRLDGIPLALELAAARVRSLAPEDLVTRLDQRFTLLTRGSRAALERQQTLRSTIDWSYDLLAERERDALMRLSVFAGGCDLVAAETVVAGTTVDRIDVADALGQLVDKSLLNVDDQRGRARYRMLETIRQYAQDRLETSGLAPSVRQAHAEYYVALAESAGPHLRGADQLKWAQDLAVEVDNLRAALDWAVENGMAAAAARLVAPLAIHGIEVGYAAMDWAGAAAAIPGAASQPLFATVASWAAWGAISRRDWDRARALLDDVAVVEASGSYSAASRRAAATLAFFTGDVDSARQHADEWVSAARATGDAYEVSQALVMQAVAVEVSEHRDTIAILEEAVQLAREANIPSALSIALTGLAIGLIQGSDELDPDTAQRAISFAQEAIAVGTIVGDHTSISSATGVQGQIALRRGEWRLALEASAEAARMVIDFGTPMLAGISIYAAVGALAGLGRFEPAAVLLAACDSLAGSRYAPEWAMTMMSAIDAKLVEQLGPKRLAELQSQGAALSAAAAVDYLRMEAARVVDERLTG